MRSWLFVPGNDRRKLNKAFASDADVVIVDWEDGVPASHRVAAHELALELLPGAVENCPRLVIRTLAGSQEGFADDLSMVERLLAAGARVAGIMLPKVEAASEIREAWRLGLPLIASVESALSLESFLLFTAGLAEFTATGARLERLALGSLDLLTDLGQSWEREQPLLEYARTRLAFVSRAAGLEAPIDGVFPPLDDPAGFTEEALAAKRLGFAGKMLIHPNQIALANDAFGQSESEMERARRVLAAYDEARDRGVGIAVLDGQMIDAPVVAWARELLERS